MCFFNHRKQTINYSNDALSFVTPDDESLQREYSELRAAPVVGALMERTLPRDSEIPGFTRKPLRGSKASEGFARHASIMHLSVATG